MRSSAELQRKRAGFVNSYFAGWTSRGQIDSILLHSLLSFDGTKAASLETEETKFMQELMFSIPKNIISSKSVEENRKEQRESGPEIDEADVSDEENIELLQVTRGMKFIEVLGQILKNRAGSFDRSAVLEILENTIDLRLRILHLFLGDVQKPEFADWLKSRLEEEENEAIARDRRRYDDAKRLKFVEKTIQLFGHVVTVGMIGKVAHSIGSEKLLEPLGILCDQIGTSAYKLICFRVQLSQRGVDYDSLKTLHEEFEKSRNYWAQRQLSFYVQSHINTHKTDQRIKQRVFELLGLNRPAIDVSHLSNR